MVTETNGPLEDRPVTRGRIEWYAMVWTKCDKTPGCAFGRDHTLPCHVDWELLSRAKPITPVSSEASSH